MNIFKSTLQPGCQWAKLGDELSEAQSGFACGERDPHGTIQLRMNNVDTHGHLIWDQFIRVPATPSTIAKYRLINGDVIFNNTNSTELVGKSALFKDYKEVVVYSNHFTRLRTVPTKLIPEYLAAWLNHQWQNHLFENICNRWIGQSAVKAEKLLSLEISLPPIAEQQRIISTLNEQLAAVEHARAAAEGQLKTINELTSKLLRRAFEGGL